MKKVQIFLLLNFELISSNMWSTWWKLSSVKWVPFISNSPCTSCILAYMCDALFSSYCQKHNIMIFNWQLSSSPNRSQVPVPHISDAERELKSLWFGQKNSKSFCTVLRASQIEIFHFNYPLLSEGVLNINSFQITW